MSEFVKHVDYVRSLDIEYIYLLGNHDMYKPNDSKYHALLPLKGRIKGFTVVDEICDINDITYVPYQHDISKFPSVTQKICVAHQTFQGADYGDIRTKDGVLAEGVICDVIISGHIHKRQTLAPDNKVIYPGSPFSQTASDVNEIKGLLLFDSETYAQSFIRCPLPMWCRIKQVIDPSFTTDDLHQMLSGQLNKTDHWLLDLTGAKAEIGSYLGSKHFKDLIEGVDLKIKTSFTDREKRQLKIEATSMESIVSQYIDKVYSGSLDKTVLQLKALEVLKQSSNA